MSPASNDSISGSKRFFCLTAPGLASEQPESAGFDLKDKLRLPLFERHFRARLSSSASRCSAISFFRTAR